MKKVIAEMLAQMTPEERAERARIFERRTSRRREENSRHAVHTALGAVHGLRMFPPEKNKVDWFKLVEQIADDLKTLEGMTGNTTH